MPEILEGRTLSSKLLEDLKKRVLGLESRPSLTIVQVGDIQESNLYIQKKKEFGEKIGVSVKHLKFAENISQPELENEIFLANSDSFISGIIIQLPLPAHLNFNSLIAKVDPKKDIDGLSAVNVQKLFNNDQDGIVPATVRGVMTLLDHYKIEIQGKKTVIVGRSILVGKPLALSFLNRNATVTICHRKTQNLKAVTKEAEILVTAMGQPEFINKDFVSSGQIVLDVGINTVSGSKMEDEISSTRKVVGDVKFSEVKDIVSAITPVPGGIGPLTVASLFQNLLDSVI